MHKLFTRNLRAVRFSALGVLAVMMTLCSTAPIQAAVARQSFLGFGPGIEFYSQSGSGTGFYLQGFGGYNFTSNIGVGINLGFSRVGGLGLDTWDFGPYLQYTDPDSGLYGKLILNGVDGVVDYGSTRNGIVGSQLGFAPGVGLGMLIPTAGSFHMAPEADYRLAFLTSAISLIDLTFNLVWDF